MTELYSRVLGFANQKWAQVIPVLKKREKLRVLTVKGTVLLPLAGGLDTGCPFLSPSEGDQVEFMYVLALAHN